MTGIALSTAMFGLPSQGGAGAVLNSKARAAKALFTTTPAIAPWLKKGAEPPLLSRANALLRQASLLDASTAKQPTDPDVRLSFATFGALDKLRSLAQAAARDETSPALRAKFADRFQSGLDELQNYLAATHGDKLNVGFRQLRSTASTVALKAGADAIGRGLSAERTDPIAGLSGTERISITMTKAGRTDTVVANLATITGPLTADAVADALNDAIASVPLLDSGGAPVLDENGAPVARYRSSFEVTKSASGKWGLTLKGLETEQIKLADPDAKASLVATVAIAAKGISARVVGFNAPGTALQMTSMTDLVAIDGKATSLETRIAGEASAAAYDKLAERAKAVGLPAPPKPAAPSVTVAADMTAAATATDQYGNVFVVGTTAGDVGGQVNDDVADLLLTKLDPRGEVVWQRLLGSSGPTQGAAIAFDADGSVVVAGTTAGALTASDQLDGRDAFVAKFRSNGDEVFVTQLDTAAPDGASAVAVDATGRILVAGSSGLSPAEGGRRSVYVAELDANGKMVQRRTLASTADATVSAIAVGGNNDLVLATGEGGAARVQRLDTNSLADLGPALELGQVRLSSLAVDQTTGSIAFGGTASSDLANVVALNGRLGGSDGFVGVADATLSSATARYVGTGGTDTIDSVAYVDGQLYAGGKTSGVLADSKQGPTDAFVARFDPALSVADIDQFGRLETSTQAVMIAGSPAGNNAVTALGLRPGEQSGAVPTKLLGQTSLRPGDHFFVKLAGDRKVRIEVGQNDTLETLASQIRLATFNRLGASVSSGANGKTLRLASRSGVNADLLPGENGRDALGKLGLEPTRLYTPKITKGSGPITPGGTFALELSEDLGLNSKQAAGFTVKRLDAAIRTIQSAYRSLFWDDVKAQIASGMPASPRLDPRQSSQIKAYQAALARLGG